MIRFKKTFLLLIVLSLIPTLTACASVGYATKTDQWETYQAEKKITVGFDNTFAPMGFKDENGKTVGIDIDLANAVFAEYGIKVDWQPINWSMKETELENGTIDLIWNGYSVSDERKEKVLFTDVYMETEEVLVVKKSSGIASLADMADKTLGVQAASSGYDAFLASPAVLKDIVKGKNAVQYANFTQLFIDLEHSRVDALLTDKVYANYYLSKENKLADYTVIPANLESGDFAVGARKADKTLVRKINAAFKQLYQKGQFQAISNKWLGQDAASPAVKAK